MPTPAETVESIAAARSLNERVQRIRRIGENHGTGEQPGIFAALADQLYVPLLTPDFAYVHWRDLYELSDLVPVYERLVAATDHFTKVSEDDLTAVVREHPATLRVLRLITGLLTQEFAAATVAPAKGLDIKP